VEATLTRSTTSPKAAPLAGTNAVDLAVFSSNVQHASKTKTPPGKDCSSSSCQGTENLKLVLLLIMSDGKIVYHAKYCAKA